MPRATRSQNNLALRFFVRNCIFPNATLAQLGVVLGGISVLALLQHALKFGFAAAISIVVRWYDTFLGIVLGWLKGPVETFVVWILASFNVSATIYDHWVHIFVIANVYFLRNTFSYTKKGTDGAIRRDLPATTSVAAISLVFSVLLAGFAGAIDAEDPTTNFLVAWIPLVGFFLYDIIERTVTVLVLPGRDAYREFGLSRLQAFWRYSKWALERFVGTTIIAALLVAAVALGVGVTAAKYGVVVFLVCTMALAIYWVSGRASLNFQHTQADMEEPTLIRLMRHSGTTFLGAMMLGTVFWGGIFLVLNAGLGLVGL